MSHSHWFRICHAPRVCSTCIYTFEYVPFISLYIRISGFTSLYSHFCIHISVFTFLYTYSHFCIQISVFTCLYSHVFTFLYSHFCIHISVFTSLYSHLCIHISAFTFLYSHLLCKGATLVRAALCVRRARRRSGSARQAALLRRVRVEAQLQVPAGRGSGEAGEEARAQAGAEAEAAADGEAREEAAKGARGAADATEPPRRQVFFFAHPPISPICRTPLFPYLTF